MSEDSFKKGIDHILSMNQKERDQFELYLRQHESKEVYETFQIARNLIEKLGIKKGDNSEK